MHHFEYIATHSEGIIQNWVTPPPPRKLWEYTLKWQLFDLFKTYSDKNRRATETRTGKRLRPKPYQQFENLNESILEGIVTSVFALIVQVLAKNLPCQVEMPEYGLIESARKLAWNCQTHKRHQRKYQLYLVFTINIHEIYLHWRIKDMRITDDSWPLLHSSDQRSVYVGSWLISGAWSRVHQRHA